MYYYKLSLSQTAVDDYSHDVASNSTVIPSTDLPYIRFFVLVDVRRQVPLVDDFDFIIDETISADTVFSACGVCLSYICVLDYISPFK